MTLTFAFDVYGTLIDTHGLVDRLADMAGDRAAEFSKTWREKQLEYSFRRGLMKRYDTFARCTRDALEYTCRTYGVRPETKAVQTLMQGYRTLPAFADAGPALEELKASGHKLYAFSNGTAEAVETLLLSAGIRELFHGVVSVDPVGSFKPDPKVYAHFLNTTGAAPGDAWLVSGNPFDVIGAVSAGMHAAWVRRSTETVFDPWGIEPDITVTGLDRLKESLA
ncbi:MAG: haloacid dehalogenase type II [Desulfobacterales bacterium]|nr:haloacid dehalogenase type II [Desulfobacterales bacterium]